MEKFASRELPVPYMHTVFETKPRWLLRGGDVGSWGWDTQNASERDELVLLSRSGNGHTHHTPPPSGRAHRLPPWARSAHPVDANPTARGLWHIRTVKDPSVSPPAPKHPPDAGGRCRPLPHPCTHRPAHAAAGKRCDDWERACFFFF